MAPLAFVTGAVWPFEGADAVSLLVQDFPAIDRVVGEYCWWELREVGIANSADRMFLVCTPHVQVKRFSDYLHTHVSLTEHNLLDVLAVVVLINAHELSDYARVHACAACTCAGFDVFVFTYKLRIFLSTIAVRAEVVSHFGREANKI